MHSLLVFAYSGPGDSSPFSKAFEVQKIDAFYFIGKANKIGFLYNNTKFQIKFKTSIETYQFY